MARRRIDAKRFRILSEELTALEKEGLRPETVEEIRGMIEPMEVDHGAWSRRVVFTFFTLAVVMFALAAFQLIRFNWDKIPPFWKITVVLVAWGGTLTAGFLARWRGRWGLSEILLFLGGILYGVGIWQIGQVFNLSASYAHGVWLWGVGVWLMAFAGRTVTLPILATLLLTISGLMTVEEGFDGFGPGFYGFPVAAWSLPLLAGLGRFFFSRRSIEIPVRFYDGLLFLWGILFPFFFPSKWNDGSLFYWFAIWAFIGLSVRIFWLRKTLFSPSLFLLIFTLMVTSFYKVNDSFFSFFPHPVLMTVLSNVFLLALLIHLICRRGQDQGKTFVLGVFGFVIWAWCRYVNLLGDKFGYLGGAVFFVIMAALLTGFAIFWRRRQVGIEGETPARKPEPGHVVPHYSTGMTTFWILTIATLFQIGVLGEMILSRTVGFRDAVEITVETEPVDPVDLFRGDYVQLSYSFTSVNGSRSHWDGEKMVSSQLFDDSELKTKGNLKGRTLFTLLEEEPDHVWRPVKMTTIRPTSGVYLKGYCRNRWSIHYGIDTFYVQEGKGKVIEDAIRQSGQRRTSSVPSDLNYVNFYVLVKLLVTPSGKARVTGVQIVGSPVIDDSKTPPDPLDNPAGLPPVTSDQSSSSEI